MTSFLALMRHELVLAWRQRLVLVAVVFTIPPKIVALYFIPDDLVSLWTPAYVFTEVVPFGVLFIASAMFLEKRQGTILAVSVTPISTSSWIWAKVLSLGLIALVAGLVIVVSTATEINWPLMIVTLIASAILYNLIGLLVAMYFTSVTSFFLPIAIIMMLLGLSFYWHFGFIQSQALWALPTHPAMVLLSACFDPDRPVLSILAALAVLTGWIVLAHHWCKRSFHRTVAPRWESSDA